MITLLTALALSAPGLTITWDPVTTDAEGKPETVAAYEVRVYNDVSNTLVYSNSIGPSITSVRIDSAIFGAGRWRVEVVAIDAAGNRSTPALFIYTPAADAIPPATVQNVRVAP